MTERVEGGIPVNFVYTAGIAGEAFLRGLKKGKILGNKCKCGLSYVPPRLFCEDCFSRIEKEFESPLTGKVFSFSVVNVNFDGAKTTPETIALIELGESKFMHRLNIPEERVKLGMKVKAVFRPVDERRGSINDIKHFEAI